jgi:hypothetical protein
MVKQQLPSTTSETCHGVVECTSTELLALGAAVFLLFFLATVVDLRRAMSVVDSERQRVQEEADAFDSFADRIDDLETARARTTTTDPGATTLVEAGSTAGLRRVRDAYQRTVMSVQHFDEEYGESMLENMAMEFGDDVAGAVVGGATLTPQLQETLVRRSRQARDKRLVLLDHFDDELDAVTWAAEKLGRVESSVDRVTDQPIERLEYDDQRAEWYLLEDRQEECEQVLERRQETIQERTDIADSVGHVESLEDYMYEPLSVTYPVLASGTDLVERLETTQRRLAGAMASRE